MKRFLLWSIVILAAVFAGIQLIPSGNDYKNPPVLNEPDWDTPETRALAKRACFDCHSNETQWPWYSKLAPMSWIVLDHVEEGREELNFSEWGRGKEGEESEELAEVIRDGEMPLRSYLILHPEARLSKTEKEQLVQGFIATTGGEYKEEEERYEHEEHDREHQSREHEERYSK